MKPPRRRNRGPEDAEAGDDGALWQRVARDVAPLARRNRYQAGVELPGPKPVRTEAPRTPPRPVARVAVRGAQPPATAPDLAAGAAPGLDRRTAMRLRRGQLGLDGRIDLHGHSREAAYVALTKFLNAAHGRGARCVLVITGKGRWGETGGVIRAALPGWLNDPSLRPLVVAFARAQPRDGGAGAFYVYLRRARQR